jgi:hypothetical protein
VALFQPFADRFFSLLQIFDASTVGRHQAFPFCVEHMKERFLNA